MKDETLTGPNQSHTDSTSGLRSANDMSDSIPSQGWGGQEEISGVGGDSGGAPVKSASVSGVDMGGPVGGAPIQTGDKGEMPTLSTLMNVGEEPGPMTGAGLRSAVGESPSS